MKNKKKIIMTFLCSAVVLTLVAGSVKPIQEKIPCVIVAPNLEDAVLYVPKKVDSAINWGCRDFSKDFQEATGKTLKTTPTLSGKHRLLILPAVVDNEPILKKLEKAGKLDLSRVRGKWESYIIQHVHGLSKEVPDALVVVGSSPRAVAYGLYEISEKSLGADPLKLWTDLL